MDNNNKPFTSTLGSGGCPFGHGSQPSNSNSNDEANTTPTATTGDTDIKESIKKASLMEPSMEVNKVHTGVYYGSYLKIDELLKLQEPESLKQGEGKEAHEEHLFIIIHQTYELWFKQIIHELDSIRSMMSSVPTPERHNGVIVNRLGRIVQIEKLLVDQISILETMTGLDFLEFRNLLVPASGFQSVQFRVIENKLGIIPDNRVQYQQHHYQTFFSDTDRESLAQSEKDTSLLGLVVNWLERNPFLKVGEYDFWQSYSAAVDQILQRDLERIKNNQSLTEDIKEQNIKEVEKNMNSFKTLFDENLYNAKLEKHEVRLSYKALQSALLIYLYKDEPIFHTPFLILNLLTEIDELLQMWRFRHGLMVQRIIGAKIGTGGSSGYHYLRTTIGDRYKIFLDLFNLSSYLIPRNTLPQLPKVVSQQMDFVWGNQN
ncbi:tryptophan 2,3-dioxygenase [Cavenderia fasciculata]|uniref:Tryptophan 2,3-dioxygenase n=1 Tax=Cavenderia fasciculata TaxID=261658 RepID=F4PRK0_CACFS|nr:tryptophan 2,3-dioxygenase [Cavenderia fasciculata]EGG21340.1 tryptophan 2,3-dioxygenase [Cavenderia fasciculata]|eukprot:XP_004359190.1 tryptophan 2,3-dioxygenase [Cavenderia fasciculata]